MQEAGLKAICWMDTAPQVAINAFACFGRVYRLMTIPGTLNPKP